MTWNALLLWGVQATGDILRLHGRAAHASLLQAKICALCRSVALMQSGVHAGPRSTIHPNNKYCCIEPATGGISSRMVFATLMACTAWVAASSGFSLHSGFPAVYGAMLGFYGLHCAVLSEYTCVGGCQSLLRTGIWGGYLRDRISGEGLQTGQVQAFQDIASSNRFCAQAF
eukprot:274811-Ditylum_brightwellii.AAC.1